MSDKIKYIEAKHFEKEVLNAEKVVVDFYSDECPPCEALAPKFEKLAELYGNDIKFIKIFRQKNRDLAKALNIFASPTVIFYQNGVQSDIRLTGAIKRSQLIKNLDNMLTSDRVQEIKKSIKKYNTECDVLILGAGPAGLTAAIYSAQSQLNTMVVDVGLPGGWVSTTELVSNYPGFIEPVKGFMLGHFMGEQARKNSILERFAVDVNDINLDKKEIVIDDIETVKAKKIILAMGSRPRPLNIKGEKEYSGNGISYCATCDAKYFDEKEVIVIGGGNSALEESLLIRKFAKKMTIIHQFDTFQANKTVQQKILNDPKIEILFESEPREFKKLDNNKMEIIYEHLPDKNYKSITCDGVFVFVGMIPNVPETIKKIDLDKFGYIQTNDLMQTSIQDIYAAGDIRSKHFRQITTAVADGTIAAAQITREFE